jgi:hypothetical protein
MVFTPMENYKTLDEIARSVNAYVASDGPGFRRAARTLQSLWRERSPLVWKAFFSGSLRSKSCPKE